MYYAWAGLAFERVCLQHVYALQKALGISGILSNVYFWRQKADEQKRIQRTQIDLLIDRNDQVVNLCKMKFSKSEYALNKEFGTALRRKVKSFRVGTNCKKAINITMVTTYGMAHNAYASNIPKSVVLDDLFL